MSLSISPADQAATIVGVSVKYNIPINALLGIYGQETSFGANVTTSSAGAMGPFQFIPSTARQYGYPLTNTPNLSQFQQQADAWGRYLVANNPSRSASGWAPAMKGGYTEAQAESNLSKIPQAFGSAVGDLLLQAKASGNPVPGGGVDTQQTGGIAGALDTGAVATGQAISSAADIFTWLTNPTNWLRILKLVGGAVAIFFALKALTGASVPTVKLARS
ncbi:MAG TPA: transglycosylase SLT domain-containing protein [Solirubrobacteraceae bacterium]|nr:transglycosylase SLT domain-containing protein [Solirubrobacteraceae bacterium]